MIFERFYVEWLELVCNLIPFVLSVPFDDQLAIKGQLPDSGFWFKNKRFIYKQNHPTRTNRERQEWKAHEARRVKNKFHHLALTCGKQVEQVERTWVLEGIWPRNLAEPSGSISLKELSQCRPQTSESQPWRVYEFEREREKR